MAINVSAAVGGVGANAKDKIRETHREISNVTDFIRRDEVNQMFCAHLLLCAHSFSYDLCKKLKP